MKTKDLIFALITCAILQYSNLSAQTTVQKVNPLLFLDGASLTISTIACNLSNGTSTTCYKITTLINKLVIHRKIPKFRSMNS